MLSPSDKETAVSRAFRVPGGKRTSVLTAQQAWGQCTVAGSGVRPLFLGSKYARTDFGIFDYTMS